MTYDPSWDLPHTPSEDIDWQESDCYWAWDARQGVGLFHRLGQYPNRGTAQLQLFVFKVGGRRFRLVAQTHPGPAIRTATGQRIGGSTAASLGDSRMAYTWNEAESDGEVDFYDAFYTPRGWLTPGDEARYEAEMHDGGHLECSGRLRGRVRVGEESIVIDALAHRDRSWGRRNLGASYQHRMCTGTLGQSLSWATVLVQFVGGQVAKMGFIAREGRAQQLKDVEFLTTVDYDSLSVTGAVTRLHLDHGEVIEIVSRTEQAFLNSVPDYASSCDSIMSVNYNGAVGFTYHTAAINSSRGVYVPTGSEVSSLAVEDGLGATRRVLSGGEG